MANTHKTKAEILQELESIKGLLLEEDDIPILQEMETDNWLPEPSQVKQPSLPETQYFRQHESVLPGQGSLFDEPTVANPADSTTLNSATKNNIEPETLDNQQHSIARLFAQHQADKKNGFASHINPLLHNATQPTPPPRPLAKASGENPFLPQHIRDRLHGNNPPPLFEYETAKKIISATKNIAHKTNKPRQHLIDDVIQGMMPQIESELRHRLFAMSVEDLEKLLNEDEDV